MSYEIRTNYSMTNDIWDVTSRHADILTCDSLTNGLADLWTCDKGDVDKLEMICDLHRSEKLNTGCGEMTHGDTQMWQTTAWLVKYDKWL